jgi:hypothetical protein
VSPQPAARVAAVAAHAAIPEPLALVNALMPACSFSAVAALEHRRVLKGSAIAAGGFERVVDSSKLPELARSPALSASEATLFAVFTSRDPRDFFASARRRDGRPLGRVLLSWIIFNSVVRCATAPAQQHPSPCCELQGPTSRSSRHASTADRGDRLGPKPGAAELHMAKRSDSTVGPRGEILLDDGWRSEPRPVEAAAIHRLTWPFRRLTYVLRPYAHRVG